MITDLHAPLRDCSRSLQSADILSQTMVLDPFTALGVASNIVHFIQLAGELFSKTKEISKSASGATKDNEAVLKATQRLQQLCENFNGFGIKPYYSADASQDEGYSGAQLRRDEENHNKTVEEIASNCAAMAKELLNTLEEVKPKAPNKKLSNLRAALETVWRKDMIKGMELRLVESREELHLALTSILKYDTLLWLPSSTTDSHLNPAKDSLGSCRTYEIFPSLIVSSTASLPMRLHSYVPMLYHLCRI